MTSKSIHLSCIQFILCALFRIKRERIEFNQSNKQKVYIERREKRLQNKARTHNATMRSIRLIIISHNKSKLNLQYFKSTFKKERKRSIKQIECD